MLVSRLCFSRLKEAAERSDTLKSECDSRRSQLEEAARWSDDLARRLEVKEAEVREMEALRRETADLRLLTTSLQQRLEENQQEAQLSRTQLSNLEAILDLLHLREVGKGWDHRQRRRDDVLFASQYVSHTSQHGK